jgi:hypothetical protein
MVVPRWTHCRASLVISPLERKVCAATSCAVAVVAGSDTSVCRSERIDDLDDSGVDGDSYLALRPIA